MLLHYSEKKKGSLICHSINAQKKYELVLYCHLTSYQEQKSNIGSPKILLQL